jgi:hypothetical protein
VLHFEAEDAERAVRLRPGERSIVHPELARHADDSQLTLLRPDQ